MLRKVIADLEKLMSREIKTTYFMNKNYLNYMIFLITVLGLFQTGFAGEYGNDACYFVCESGNYDDEMGAFYDMMLIRDKRVGTRQSLNDDVIGVIFSYL